MKVFKLAMAIVFALQSQVSSAGIAQDVKDTSILQQSGTRLGDWWAQVKPVVSKTDQKIVDPMVRVFADFKIPKITATKIRGNGVRIILQDNAETVTIDLFEDSDRMAVVNGVAFSHQELLSLKDIFEKLVPKPQRAMIDGGNKWLMFVSVVYLLVVPSGEAAATCKQKSGAICWDQITGEYPQVYRQLKEFVSANSISPQAVAEAANIANSEFDSCVKKSGPEKCQTQFTRKSALKKIADPNLKQTAVQTSKVADSEPSFWERNKSWLKPLAIVAGIGVFVWGLCKSNAVQIFGCGKKSDSDSGTAGLPGSVPTNPIYTGAGAK